MAAELRMADIRIYTDGGCHGNPGPGGWAYVIIAGEFHEEMNGFEGETTNNRMELTAAIEALESIEDAGGCDHKDITLYTDSQYIKKGISEWIITWVRNGWMTTSKKPVKNKDLWRKLKELSDKCTPNWNWVKGHAGDVFNERCDFLVQEAIKNKIL